jgi:hypothetical protein
VLGGQIPVSINVLGEVMPHIRSGKLRGLAVTSAQRSPFLPDVPTLVEQGYKDIAVQEYLGWFVPAKTPADTVARLNTLVREGLQAPDFVAALADNGLQPLHQSPEEFAAWCAATMRAGPRSSRRAASRRRTETGPGVDRRAGAGARAARRAVRQVFGIVGGKLGAAAACDRAGAAAALPRRAARGAGP